MAKTKGEFIKCNFEVFKGFVKYGSVSTTDLNYYKIYCYHCSLPKSLPQMQKHSQTSEDLGVSERLVRKAVREMNKKI